MKKDKKNKTPWPTKKAMEQVYDMKLWGDNGDEFYSGDGSHHPEIINPYIDVVNSFLVAHHKKLTVCDLGCGDFNVGKNLVDNSTTYIAVDIVPRLILNNKEKYIQPNLTFECLDIAVDTLPKADCLLVRQVLQHLSNKEILAVTKKMVHYKYVIVTEHIPKENFVPNKDIISGQGIRLKKNSGVCLRSDPFNLKVKKEKVLLIMDALNHPGVLRTTLYEL